ncbi:hypothetical protein KQI84_18520 [bacterium]|nr:hypothetical protein [bacterium]
MSRERFEELLDPWLMGELGAEEQAEFEQLLHADPELAEEAEDHRELAGLMAGAPVPAAPAGLLAGALEKAKAAEVIEIAPRRRPFMKWAIGSAAAAVIVFGAYMATDVETVLPSARDSNVTTPDELIAHAQAERRVASEAIPEKGAEKEKSLGTDIASIAEGAKDGSERLRQEKNGEDLNSLHSMVEEQVTAGAAIEKKEQPAAERLDGGAGNALQMSAQITDAPARDKSDDREKAASAAPPVAMQRAMESAPTSEPSETPFESNLFFETAEEMEDIDDYAPDAEARGLSDNIVEDSEADEVVAEVEVAPPALGLHGAMYKPGTNLEHPTTSEVLAENAKAIGGKLVALPGDFEAAADVSSMAGDENEELVGQWSAKAAPTPAQPLAPETLALVFPDEASLSMFWYRAQSVLAAADATGEPSAFGGGASAPSGSGMGGRSLRMPDELRNTGELTEMSFTDAASTPLPSPAPDKLHPPYLISDYDVHVDRRGDGILVTIRPKLPESSTVDE